MIGSVNSHTDILELIGNLSSVEVSTPPAVANAVLDMLPPEVWTDSSLRWLDPASKTGVFLREITRRLMDGLEPSISDPSERLKHILTEMVFGFATSDLASLISRRTIYGAKDASSDLAHIRFTSPEANVWYEKVNHFFSEDGRCIECKGTRAQLEKKGQDNQAYGLIHVEGRAKIANQISMNFDVIVGNPPYSMSDGGGEGASGIPIYNLFVEQAIELNPKHIAVMTQARWYSGGKGLNKFRKLMLVDSLIAELHDFPETDLVFPGLNIRGGICYFKWTRDHEGDALIVNYRRGKEPTSETRPLLEPGLTKFIRYNEAVPIVRKVLQLKEETFSKRVQSRNPYGIPSNFSDYSKTKTEKAPVLLYRRRRGEKSVQEVYIKINKISKNLPFKDLYKVLVSKVSPGGDEYPQAIFTEPFVASPGTVSTETFLIVDFPRSKKEGRNLVGYMKTRFFRFLVAQSKDSHNISKASFAFVPVQDMSQMWSDKKLYEKYGITADEQRFIETLVKGWDS